MKSKVAVFLSVAILCISAARADVDIIDQPIGSENLYPPIKTRQAPWQQDFDEEHGSSSQLFPQPPFENEENNQVASQIPDIPSESCVLIVYSTNIVDRYITNYMLIKHFYKQFPGKQYITPEEFQNLRTEQVEEVNKSREFYRLRGKFDRFIKTYKGNNFIFKFNSNNYFVTEDSVKVFKEDFQSILLTPGKCKIVDIAEVAVVALLGEPVYDSIIQAEQGMYIYFNNGDNWNFSPL